MTYETPVPTQYIYRVEHKFICSRTYPTSEDYSQSQVIGIGPYVYARHWNVSPKSLHEALWKGEPCDTYQYDIEKLIAAGRPLHALWNHPRPGPREDPYLRDWFVTLPKSEQLKWAYGSATLEQLFEWFNDQTLIEVLSRCNFLIRRYRSKAIKVGLRQALFNILEPFVPVATYTFYDCKFTLTKMLEQGKIK